MRKLGKSAAVWLGAAAEWARSNGVWNLGDGSRHRAVDQVDGGPHAILALQQHGGSSERGADHLQRLADVTRRRVAAGSSAISSIASACAGIPEKSAGPVRLP